MRLERATHLCFLSGATLFQYDFPIAGKVIERGLYLYCEQTVFNAGRAAVLPCFFAVGLLDFYHGRHRAAHQGIVIGSQLKVGNKGFPGRN